MSRWRVSVKIVAAGNFYFPARQHEYGFGAIFILLKGNSNWTLLAFLIFPFPLLFDDLQND